MSKEPWEVLRDSERSRWLKMIIGDYTFEKMEDYSPERQTVFNLWLQGGSPHIVHGNKNDCLSVLGLFERYDHPLDIAMEVCKFPTCVIFDIPITRDAHLFPTHKSVLFADLMRLCGKYDLVAYKYHTREYEPYKWEKFYLLYRVPREQIFVGARMFWKNDAGVLNLEHLFARTVKKIKDEITIAYEDLAGKSVLDLGCGTGRLPAAFPGIGVYTGVDQSEMMLKTAALHAPEDNELVCLPIKQYESSSRFHVITAIDILQHSERPRDLALYILNHFRSNCVLFRTVINELDYPVYHATSMGTTSVSHPLAYYEQLAEDMALHCNGTAEIFHCEPLEGEKKCRTQTHGIIIKVKRGMLL